MSTTLVVQTPRIIKSTKRVEPPYQSRRGGAGQPAGLMHKCWAVGLKKKINRYMCMLGLLMHVV